MKLINTILFIIVFISMILIPQYVMAKTFEVTFVWEHSGTGMDKFVFIPSTIDAGPWIGEPQPVMISDITPTVVNEKNRWETTITIEIESFEEMKWWVCYAETSYGERSLTSEPAESILIPNQPHSIRKLKDVELNKITVFFI